MMYGYKTTINQPTRGGRCLDNFLLNDKFSDILLKFLILATFTTSLKCKASCGLAKMSKENNLQETFYSKYYCNQLE